MVTQADVSHVQAAIASGAFLFDVREPFEFASGHVPGALSIPMHLVPLRLDELPKDRDLYVICATGNRSWQIANYLGERGIAAVNVAGGTKAWQSAGLPIEKGAPESPSQGAPLPNQPATGGGAPS
ncbi:MAG: rhodanese-like domain-containing protein [Actinomycetes bacterium]